MSYWPGFVLSCCSTAHLVWMKSQNGRRRNSSSVVRQYLVHMCTSHQKLSCYRLIKSLASRHYPSLTCTWCHASWKWPCSERQSHLPRVQDTQEQDFWGQTLLLMSITEQRAIDSCTSQPRDDDLECMFLPLLPWWGVNDSFAHRGIFEVHATWHRIYLNPQWQAIGGRSWFGTS